MDDYVTKPIELKGLQKRLFKWLGKSSYSPDLDQTDIVPEPEVSRSDKPIDKDMLKKYVGVDEDFQKKFLESYLNVTNKVLDEFDQAVAMQDWQSVSLLAHKLKSSSRAAGAIKLGDYCKELEYSCKQETDNNREEIIERFLSEAGRVQAYLQEIE